eukprot:4985425-Alexandrium_andersonii.AAC.1
MAPNPPDECLQGGSVEANAVLACLTLLRAMLSAFRRCLALLAAFRCFGAVLGAIGLRPKAPTAAEQRLKAAKRAEICPTQANIA